MKRIVLIVALLALASGMAFTATDLLGLHDQQPRPHGLLIGGWLMLAAVAAVLVVHEIRVNRQ